MDSNDYYYSVVICRSHRHKKISVRVEQMFYSKREKNAAHYFREQQVGVEETGFQRRLVDKHFKLEHVILKVGVITLIKTKML